MSAATIYLSASTFISGLELQGFVTENRMQDSDSIKIFNNAGSRNITFFKN